jgi:uncharacterized protein YeaO (DUF488 family)
VREGRGRMIKVQRIYSQPDKGDGFRVLVDRLWPRGLKKEDVTVDLWLKDVAPSNELREWFAHDPQKWDEFQQKYFMELDSMGDPVAMLISKAEEGDMTLLYSAKDEEFNNAVALKKYLEDKMREKTVETI